MMWSCTAMPSGFATSMIACVIWMSARDGVGSAGGMVVHQPRRCRRTLKSEMFVVVTSELGAVIGGGPKCSFVTVPLGHGASRQAIFQHGRSRADVCFSTVSRHC